MAVLFLVSQAPAQLITNGSFENPTVFLDATFFAVDVGITGWTIGAVSVDIPTDELLNFSPAYHGHQTLDLEGSPGPGSISQSFPTNLGETYQLFFAYSRNNNEPEVYAADPSSALVTVIGTATLLSETFESSLIGPVLLWTPVTRLFVADSTLTTLTFASNNGPNGFYGGILIDGVSVELVPEPSTLVLAAFCLIGLATWGWRRKR